jgi:hypothetical protein
MLSIADLEAMRATQESSMQDTCRRWVYVETKDDYGQAVVEYMEGELFPCGFQPTPVTNRLIKRINSDYVAVDAEIRLPLSAYGQITALDRVQLVARFGDTAAGSDDLYEIVGEILPGPTGIVIGLRKVLA